MCGIWSARNKGPEPEAIELGQLFGRTFAFVGLERIGGVATFDITDPIRVRLVDYVNDRDFSGDAEAGAAGPLGPEGLRFVPREESPFFLPLLLVANEVSGSTDIYVVLPRFGGP